MGFTRQMDCQLYYRRAAAGADGAPEWKRRLIAELRARNTTETAAA